MEKRTALFLPSLRGGGAERVAVKLAEGFLEAGLKVDLVLAKAEGPYLSELPEHENFCLFDLKSPRILYALPKLAWYLRREKPLIILSFLNHANIVAIWAKLLSQYRGNLIVSEHTFLSINSKQAKETRAKFIPHLAKKFYPLANKVVCVSKGVEQDLKNLGIPENKLAVIYNPVITKELFEKAKEPLSHPWFKEKIPVVLGVGRLTPAKDFPTLLKAFSLARQKRKVRLIILGEGEERSKLVGLAKELGVEEDVDFPGFDPNPYRWMKRADVFVLSSRWEGLPGVLIEALALGTPVVATDCPSGPREILKDGKWGRLVPVGDAVVLAQAIVEILDGKRKLVLAGLKNCLEKFTSEWAVKQYIKCVWGEICRV